MNTPYFLMSFSKKASKTALKHLFYAIYPAQMANRFSKVLKISVNFEIKYYCVNLMILKNSESHGITRVKS